MDGKININEKIAFKLPMKYPPMFNQETSYYDPIKKKEIKLVHKDKIKLILEEIHKNIQPILKNFKISYSLLTEAPINHKKVATTQKIKLELGSLQNKCTVYTHHIQIKIRNPENPNNIKLFINKTTIYAILLHELAHIKFSGHEEDFMYYLRDIYKYGNKLNIFNSNEEHLIPSTRNWERKIFENKGEIIIDELKKLFDEEKL